jgi:HEAT repeat protein
MSIEHAYTNEYSPLLATIAQLLTAWKTQGRQPEDPALHALQAIDRSQLLLHLQMLLIGEDLDLLDTTTWVLVTLEPYRAVDLLIPLLQSPQAALRWHICGFLGQYGDERSVLPLLHILCEDPDSDVRYTAATALEKSGDRRALPALLYVKDTDNGADYEGRTIQAAVRSAIQAIQNRSAVS